MYLARRAIITAFTFVGIVAAHAQSNPGFIAGRELCAANANCGTPPNPLSLNGAFALKSDYPYLGPVTGPVGGVQFSGTPSAGQALIATSPAAAAWAAIPPPNFSGLPNASNLAAADQVVVLQSGVLALASMQQVANLMGIVLPTVELNFASGAYTGLGCTSLTACTSATNNGGYAQWADGHWSAFAPNTARVTDQGLLYETVATTNVMLWSRDMSQSAWTKTNLTSALTATGIDNTPNAASTLTATSSNGTSCQTATITLSSFNEVTASVFLKRVTGTGEVDIALEPSPGHGGTVYQPITVANSQGALNGTWQRYTFTVPGVSSPVTFCVRIVTNGDSVAADFAQAEPRVWATSPILTAGTTATRQPDDVSFTGGAATVLNSGTASVVVATSGAAAGNFRHQLSPPYIGGTANGYLWQFAPMAAFFNSGSQGAGVAPYAICGSVADIAANQSMALPAIFGYAWGSTGNVLVGCDGGSIYYPGGAAPASQTWYVGSSTDGPTAYTTDVKLFAQALSQTQMAAATVKNNNVILTDQQPTAGEWNQYTGATTFPATVGGTLPAFSGGPTQNDYGIATGTLSSGINAPLQLGPVGNYIRFNMYANNCSVEDFCMTGSYGGSERAELDGSTGAMGTAQFASATDAWMSYSICIEPGAPLTSNWFFTGQVHQTINPSGGSSPPFAMNTIIGETGQVEFVNNGNQDFQIGNTWRQLRGVWYNYVLQLNFDPSGAQGKIHVWQNGTQIVNYNGVTGQTPTSGTQQYYWKFGVYRGQSPEYQAVRYANMTYSSSSLASKISSPDAIASGYGTTCQ